MLYQKHSSFKLSVANFNFIHILFCKSKEIILKQLVILSPHVAVLIID